DIRHSASIEHYALALHDALPIYPLYRRLGGVRAGSRRHDLPPRRRALPMVGAGGCRGDGVERPHPADALTGMTKPGGTKPPGPRLEEHTSELQSLDYLVCRLLHK